MSPAAEDVVIGAAYRALMRHYHPDTNPDPAAQARAREITAAYAVLRDPAKRAEYDAQRADGDLWSADERGHAPLKPPPAMRTVGIAAAALALALVALVWTLAENSRPKQPASLSQPAKAEPARSAPSPAYPVVQLQPESERLARLREEAEILSPPPVAPSPDETAPPDPIVAPAKAQLAPIAVAQVPRRSAPAQSGPKATIAEGRTGPPK